MEEIGVEAIVEGLSSFLGDIDKVNGALDKLRPSAGLLENAFNTVTGVLDDFANSIIHVAEVALGMLLRDAIDWAIGQLVDLGKAAVEAGSQFQILTLRLNGLNLQTLIDSGMEYDKAVENSIKLTQEQLTWLMKIAAVTPYDATDISNIYTLARSYGFADDEARNLVTSITDFAAGMGLDNTALERIIINFGQMVQRGKITTREMTDLARGSLVPLQDVLKRVAQNMGITTEELTKMIQTADGVPADEFIKAFQEMTTEEVRFNGASERMAKTFKGATANLYETIRDLFGKFLAMPILDVLGQKLAGVLDAFTNPDTWNRISLSLSGLGESIAGIFSELLGGFPTGGTIADTFINWIDKISSWVTDHRDEIIGFFREDIPNFIQKIADFINTYITPAFNTISDWVSEHGELISEFFGSLGNIIGTVFANLTGGNINPEMIGGGLDTFLEGIANFMTWVVEHQADISRWATTISEVVIAYELLSGAINLAIGGIAWLLGNIPTLITVLGSLVSTISWDLTIAFEDFAQNGKNSIVDLWWSVRDYFSYLWFDARDRIGGLRNDVVDLFWDMRGSAWNVMNGFRIEILDLFGQMIQSILHPEGKEGISWWGLGYNIVWGMINGFNSSTGTLYNAMVNSVMNAYYAILRNLGIHSPSTVMNWAAQMTMEGFIGGIESYAGRLNESMARVMGSAMAPAMAMPAVMQSYMATGSTVNTSYQNNNTYALHINSSAKTEPILADFSILQSLNGA
jgi:tape measure domain-containing protein